MASASFPVVGHFLAWWGRELVACVPGRLRDLLAPAPRRLDVAPVAGGVALRLTADGRELASVVLDPAEPGAGRAARRLASGAARIVLRLPADAALYPRLHLPLSAAADLRACVAAEIDRATPFPRDAVLFDARAVGSDLDLGRLHVEALVAPRPAVAAALAAAAALGLRVDRVDGPRAEAPGAAGFDLGADGGARRPRPVAQRLIGPLVLLVGALGALATGLGYAARMVEADALASRLAALRAQNAELAEIESRLAQLAAADRFLVARRMERPGTLALLAEVSDRLPDTVWLHGFTYDAGALRLEGAAQDASALPNLLERSPLLEGVAFAAPVTRAAGDGVDRFSVALTTAAVPAAASADGETPMAQP